MNNKSDRICIYFKIKELEMFDELCKRKGYVRSSFIKEILLFCAENDCTPAELALILREYKYLRSRIDNKINEGEAE